MVQALGTPQEHMTGIPNQWNQIPRGDLQTCKTGPRGAIIVCRNLWSFSERRKTLEKTGFSYWGQVIDSSMLTFGSFWASHTISWFLSSYKHHFFNFGLGAWNTNTLIHLGSFVAKWALRTGMGAKWIIERAFSLISLSPTLSLRSAIWIDSANPDCLLSCRLL